MQRFPIPKPEGTWYTRRRVAMVRCMSTVTTKVLEPGPTVPILMRPRAGGGFEWPLIRKAD